MTGAISVLREKNGTDKWHYYSSATVYSVTVIWPFLFFFFHPDILLVCLSTFNITLLTLFCYTSEVNYECQDNCFLKCKG